MKKIIVPFLLLSFLPITLGAMEQKNTQIAENSGQHWELVASGNTTKQEQKRSHRKRRKTVTPKNTATEPEEKKEGEWSDISWELKSHVLSFLANQDLILALKDLKNCEQVDRELNTLAGAEHLIPSQITRYVEHNRPQAEQSFVRASGTGDLASVKLLKAAGIDNEVRDKSQKTALLKAVENGKNNIVKYLIEEGANVSTLFPLLQACGRQNQEVVNMLLEKHALNCSEADQEILTATIWGLTDIVDEFIEEGAAVNTADDQGITLLMYAASSGNEALVSLLLDKNATIDRKNGAGQTALMLAAQFGHINIVRLLMRHGANINAADKQLFTALMLAAHNGHLNIVIELIKNNADIAARNNNGETALALTAATDHLDVMQALIASKAEVNTKNNMLLTPLMGATIAGQLESAQLLINNGADIDAKARSGTTALGYASFSKHYGLVNLLIKHKAQTGVIDDHSGSRFTNNINTVPLVSACHSRDIEGIKLLLDNNVDVNAQDQFGATALIAAIIDATHGENVEVIRTLLEAGAEVNVKIPASLKSVLDIAVTLMLNKETVELLLMHGADANSEDKNLCTPLMTACAKRNKDIVELLIKYRADVSRLAPNGNCPLMCALGLTREEHAALGTQGNLDFTKLPEHYLAILELLLTHGADVNLKTQRGINALTYAINIQCPELVKMLLDKGADLTATDGAGKTPLNLAQQRGDIAIITMLKQESLIRACKSGDVNAIGELLDDNSGLEVKDEAGCTPLMIAVTHGHVEIVKALLKAEVDKNARNSEGMSILMCAILSHGNKEIIEMLIHHGARINSKDNNLRTPLMHACSMRQRDIVELLMRINLGPDIHAMTNIDAMDIDNETALMHAIRLSPAEHHAVFAHESIDFSTLPADYLATITCLLDYGADVNLTGKNRESALMVAVKLQYPELVKLLLTRGAEVRATDSTGTTIMDLAQSLGDTDIIHLLTAQK